MSFNFSDAVNGHFFVMAGPCVIEDKQMLIDAAFFLKELADDLQVRLVFKASYDKANRTSVDAFRGIGFDQGLAALAEVKKQTKLPILTDVHQVHEVAAVAEVADVIQIPAFLCRQTDILLAAGESQKVVQVKKGQFLAPKDMKFVAEKIAHTGNNNIIFCERGTSFGYGNLVVDMRSLAWMRDLGYPVVFDGTHAVQTPGSLGGATGGNRELVPLLFRAAVAAGVDGIFFETHRNPDKALSDGPNCLPHHAVRPLLEQLLALNAMVTKEPLISSMSKHDQELS